MTADTAHVAAVAEALMNAPAPSLGPFLAPIAATVAVETLTPLIRAQVAASMTKHARVIKGEHMWCECRLWNSQCDWTHEEHLSEMAARIAGGTP